MKANQLKLGVILSYMTQAVHILSGLLYTPVMLRILGKGEYGLYQLVASVVSYLSLLSLGFASSYMRFYSRNKVRDDKKGIATLNGMFMLIFIAIATLCIVCGSFLVFYAEEVFGSGLSVPELERARVLLAIMVFNMAATFINSVFTSYITAHEQFFFQRLIELLRALFNPFLTLPLLLLGFGSIGMVVMTTILTCGVLIANIIFSVKNLKMEFNFKQFSFGLFKEMCVFNFFIFIIMIVDQINWNIDKFLLGRMVGTGAVAVYGVAAQLNNMYISMSTAISSVFIPKVNTMVSNSENNENISSLMVKVGRIQFLVLGLVIGGFVIFGQEFIAFWAGDDYTEAYFVGLLLMVPITPLLIQNLAIEIRRAKNMQKVPTMIVFIVALINLILSVLLINHYGAIGAALGTAIATAVNIVVLDWYYQKKVQLNIKRFWNQIIRMLPGLLAPCAVGWLLNYINPYHTLWSLLMRMCIFTIVYIVSAWFISMNANEKDLVHTLLRQKIRKEN